MVHIGLALMALYERHTLRMPPAELARLVLGFAIPVLLVGHFTGTRVAWQLFGRDDPYARVVWVLWSPDYGIQQLVLITIAWAHGCLGLHFLLRYRAFYRDWFHVFFAIAILVPALGLLGFHAMAAELRALGTVIPTTLQPGQAQTLDLVRHGLFALFAVLLAGVLAARSLRTWRERSRGLTIALRYPGLVVRVPRGWSVLEASRANRIPHLALCGGRARCSTCRVRVEGPPAHLPSPEADEARTLARVRAAPDVRLACQLRPSGDIAVTPLLRAAQPHPDDFGVERDLAILFIDLRRWTGLAEKQLPHDLVYVQELFFEAVGEAVRRTHARAERAACGRVRPAPGLGIGIHAGPAALGEVGYRDTRTLSAVGDTVNTASRLQELTKHYGVPLVISERVALDAGLDRSSLDSKELMIRGRSTPMTVYALRTLAQFGA